MYKRCQMIYKRIEKQLRIIKTQKLRTAVSKNRETSAESSFHFFLKLFHNEESYSKKEVFVVISKHLFAKVLFFLLFDDDEIIILKKETTFA